VPIHLRAEPADYAEACLLPGDPLRARWIAERFLDDTREVNGERGLLGYTGMYEGTRISVQTTGMGCPSAAIVVDELIQLGVKRLLRIGTCGGLQPNLGLGGLVLALSATPIDATPSRYTSGEPFAPTADWELLHGIVHAAKELGTRISVGPIVTADTFYDPDTESRQRWSSRGLLAIEMEAAVIFTIAALRGVQAGCLLTVTDLLVDGVWTRIPDADLPPAVESMTRLALRAATSARH
jgi:purine-nucleoside phosphorylase